MKRVDKAAPDRSQTATGAPDSFTRFIHHVAPSYHFYTYSRVLIRALERVAARDITRLMVFMPPRHGKSELVSRLFPAWYLNRNPREWVGLSSYGQELANKFSRRARDYYREAGGALNDERSAVKEWETGERGGLWAAGVGGPITGSGFDVGIIDDPLKNAEEASSPTVRAKQKDWYDSTFYTREEPGGAIIIIQTRWHPDDLSGWLLDKEESSDEPEGWHIINFDALHDGEPEAPAPCTTQDDWRAQGEPLCPERFTEEKLKRIRGNISSKWWSSLYQQRPVDAEGALWSWGIIEQAAAPEMDRIVVGVDPAGGSGDEHGIVAVGRGQDGDAYVLQDATEPGSSSPATWARAVERVYDRHSADRVVVERNFGGDMVRSTIESSAPHVAVKEVNASRGKSVRAEPVAALYENGRVKHTAGLNDLEEQMTTWDPQNDSDSPDRVDALVWALTELMLDGTQPGFVIA